MLLAPQVKPRKWKWRPYQIEAMDAACHTIQVEGKFRILLGLPTGAGKTVIAGGLLQRLLIHKGMHALFLVPSIDLVKQTKNKFLMLGFDEKDIGIIQGEIKQYNRQIAIACVATIHKDKTLQKYLDNIGGKVDILIADECHYAAADTWRKVINAALPPWGVLIGMSATPYRTDNQNLQQIFTDGYAYVKDIWELINEDYLADMDTHDLDVEMDPQALKLQVDAEVRKAKAGKPSLLQRDGPFDAPPEPITNWKAFRFDAEKSISDTYRYERVYQWWMTFAQGKRTLIFGKTVEDAQGFIDYFEKKGIPGAVITSHTSVEEREELYGDPKEFWGEKQYSKFDRGEVLILANYGVLTTGNDIESIECVIMGRPTESRGLWTQCLGRGLRLCERIGKTSVMVLNLTDKHHTVMMFKHLFGVMETQIKSVKKLLKEKTEKEERQKYEFDLQEKAIVNGQITVRKSDFFMGEGWKLDEIMGNWEKACVIGGQHQVLLAEKIAGQYQPVCIDETGKPHFLSEVPMTSIDARVRCQQYLEEQNVLSEYAPRKEWNSADPIEPKQRDYLIQRQIYFERPGKKGALSPEDIQKLPITKGEYRIMTSFVHKQKRARGTSYGMLCYVEGQGVRLKRKIKGVDTYYPVPQGAYKQ